VGRRRGEMGQTMYTHVSKYKNDKRMENKKEKNPTGKASDQQNIKNSLSNQLLKTQFVKFVKIGYAS
jgi:hypothetical protein